MAERIINTHPALPPTCPICGGSYGGMVDPWLCVSFVPSRARRWWLPWLAARPARIWATCCSCGARQSFAPPVTMEAVSG